MVLLNVERVYTGWGRPGLTEKQIKKNKEANTKQKSLTFDR